MLKLHLPYDLDNFDSKGHIYICFPWLILWMHISVAMSLPMCSVPRASVFLFLEYPWFLGFLMRHNVYRSLIMSARCSSECRVGRQARLLPLIHKLSYTSIPVVQIQTTRVC